MGENRINDRRPTEADHARSGMDVTLDASLLEVRPLVEAALGEQGFGVLTVIDVAATLKTKLDKDVPPQVILGACNPQLADQALAAEPTIGLLLPCNVTLREVSDRRTVVSALDPGVMVDCTGNPALAPVAAQARVRLTAALDALAVAPATGRDEQVLGHLSDGSTVVSAAREGGSHTYRVYRSGRLIAEVATLRDLNRVGEPPLEPDEV